MTFNEESLAKVFLTAQGCDLGRGGDETAPLCLPAWPQPVTLKSRAIEKADESHERRPSPACCFFHRVRRVLHLGGAFLLHGWCRWVLVGLSTALQHLALPKQTQQSKLINHPWPTSY